MVEIMPMRTLPALAVSLSERLGGVLAIDIARGQPPASPRLRFLTTEKSFKLHLGQQPDCRCELSGPYMVNEVSLQITQCRSLSSW